MSDEGQTQTLDRRKFLTVLGVTGGGAVALSGCSTSRVEKLVPYLVQSEDQVPGVPTWYASTCTECAAGCGLHVKTREGRAIKLEGNPEHPVNRGKLCSRGQASLQGLYNPGRIKSPMLRNGDAFTAISWDDAIARLAAEVTKAAGRIGVLSGAGPGTFSDLLADWTAAAGGTAVRWEPIGHEPIRAASRSVFGVDAVPAHDFGAARYIVSFGADFLDGWLSPMEDQRGFATSHGFDGDSARFVAFSPRRDLTGLNADEWHPVAPGSEALVALAMANVIGGSGAMGGALAAHTPESVAARTGVPAATIERVARAFAAAQPSLAVAGGAGNQHRAATELATAVNLLNQVAGNVGRTVLPGAGPALGDGYEGLARLMTAMDGGQIGLLLVHEANPVYALPKAAGFREKLAKVPFKVCTSLYLDETAAACDLLLPNHHPLERWDDARPRAGVTGLMQPVMEPVFQTRATGDVLLQVAQKAGGAFARFTAPTYEAHLREAWRATAADDAAWIAALARGGVYAAGAAPAAPAAPAVSAAPALSAAPATFDGDGEFVFAPYPHPFLSDGRGANRPWLLENPDPVTKLTWHSWIELSTATAKRLDIRSGEIVRLRSPHGEIEGPVYPYPGLRDDVIAAPLGFGHTEYGQFASGRGANPLDLLGAPGTAGFIPYVSTRVRLEKTGRYREPATTEGNPRQLGRGIAEAMPLDAARRGLTVRQAYVEAGHGKHEINTELEMEAIEGWREATVESRKLGDYAVAQPAWGMAIDLSRCTGCSACVTACYAENNIPTVGEEDVLRGREMTWIRIERYWEGGEDAAGHGAGGEHGAAAGHAHPEARFIPMLCQHCENAPCEPVCPVYAAYHTPDGLNGQVYNRCVGTRYCGNNCPYKVRYFNWYKYNERAWPEPLHLQLNPDVTVRARGVMEKCTFCVQRIRGAQHQARIENRPLADGEFTTACAQACPADAIVFGNMRDPDSRVARIRANPRGYHVLEDTNVRPAITYLAKVLHPVEA
ncbi:MAG TPA: molybdopterin-dependent oxidoreductase [Gemmatimonadales bacterium]|nr:molybdopterin-dependent oxidoreductase [Gemmatimonadales bacterium]